MRVTRLKITSYRGIAALDVAVPPAGLIAAGANGKGKTTVLRAIRAALAAQDIGPDAVRLDEDRAEIIVDTDALRVRRTITPGGSTLTVATASGDKKSKPQTFLDDILGGAPLDPLDLMLARPADRRARILAALPLRVTVEELRRYVPDLPATFDVSGHGLEAIGRLRTVVYDRRTAVNAEARAKREEAARFRADAERLFAAVQLGPAGPGAAEAEVALQDARSQAAALEQQRLMAAAAGERTLAARNRVWAIRQEAARLQEIIPPRVKPARIAYLASAVADASAAVEEARAALDRAVERHREAREEEEHLRTAVGRRTTAETAIAEKRRQADELEAVLRESSVPVVEPAQIDAAQARIATAQTSVTAARIREEAAMAQTAYTMREAGACEAEAFAARLDGYVRALSHDAPAALLAASDALPGIGIDGDEVTLDGKRLGALCGAEQMRFCVEVARRAHAKARFLVVDGMERLDPEQQDAFVREATRGGWQLLATRVDAGELRLEAIEAEDESDA